MNSTRRFLLASGLTLALLAQGTAAAADKLPVVASFSILGDLVRVVGGDKVDVTTLVGPNEDAHVFQPKPTDAKAILNAKLVVINGLGFEPWANKLVKSAGYKGELLVASKGVKPLHMAEEKGHSSHGHEEADPHAWQNPNNVTLYVRNIATSLAKLDAWAKEQFAAIALPKRKVITSHDAFGYFAAQYQVKFLAPQGVNSEAEPSAKQVASLIKQIQREKIKAVFVENMSNPKLLEQLSKDAGATVGASLYSDALSTADKPGATYLQMMRHNVTQLVAGLRLN
jgi:zinc/manganese transport system substrate-binding protein